MTAHNKNIPASYRVTQLIRTVLSDMALGLFKVTHSGAAMLGLATAVGLVGGAVLGNHIEGRHQRHGTETVITSQRNGRQYTLGSHDFRFHPDSGSVWIESGPSQFGRKA